MTANEAIIQLERQLTNMSGEYATTEMPESVQKIYEAIEFGQQALQMQDKLKFWIWRHTMGDFEGMSLTEDQLISILKEFEVD